MYNHLSPRSFQTLCVTAVLVLTLVGCASKSDHVLGVAPVAAAASIVSQLSSASANTTVTLHGEMIEKCPVAGCWFMLKDKSGVVRVDTKAAGFVVSDVPLHTTMTVSGTVTTGAQREVAATGIRY